MKQISNWTIVGYVGAVFFALISTLRYFYQYPDIDKFLAYVAISILVAAVSWLYNQNLQQNYTLEAVENYLDDKRFEVKECQ